MNNEFKKLSQGNITRYVLEDATGGSTGSNSIASNDSAGFKKGLMVTREGNKTVEPPKPRNFVAKNAKMGGAGAHKDKKKAAKQGQEKHKKPFMEDHADAANKGWGAGSYNTYAGGNHERGVAENPEWYSDEANSMSTSQLKSLYKHAIKLRQAVKQMQAQGDTLEPWQQSKVTKAADYLDAVFNAVDDEHDMGEEQDMAEGKEDKIKQLKADHATAVHWSKNDTNPHKREAARQKAEKIKAHLEKQYKQGVAEEWSQKYKSSINCSHPKGFSQKAHCAGKKKHNEDMSMEAVCPDCGMCQTHGNVMEIKKGAKDANGFTRCWPGKHAVGTKKGKNGGQVRNCKPNEGVDPYFESLEQMLEKQLEPTMDLDTWIDNFQNADPNKYHQFKNKTPEKKK